MDSSLNIDSPARRSPAVEDPDRAAAAAAASGLVQRLVDSVTAGVLLPALTNRVW